GYTHCESRVPALWPIQEQRNPRSGNCRPSLHSPLSEPDEWCDAMSFVDPRSFVEFDFSKGPKTLISHPDLGSGFVRQSTARFADVAFLVGSLALYEGGALRQYRSEGMRQWWWRITDGQMPPNARRSAGGPGATADQGGRRATCPSVAGSTC